jgi:hypothetical protein
VGSKGYTMPERPSLALLMNPAKPAGTGFYCKSTCKLQYKRRRLNLPCCIDRSHASLVEISINHFFPLDSIHISRLLLKRGSHLTFNNVTYLTVGTVPVLYYDCHYSAFSPLDSWLKSDCISKHPLDIKVWIKHPYTLLSAGLQLSSLMYIPLRCLRLYRFGEQSYITAIITLSQNATRHSGRATARFLIGGTVHHCEKGRQTRRLQKCILAY